MSTAVTLPHPDTTSLPPAMVMSLLVHGAAALALATWVSVGAVKPGEARMPLAIRLVAPVTQAPDSPPSLQTTTAAVESAPVSTAPAAAESLPEPVAATPPVAAAVPVAPPPMSSGDALRVPMGSVAIRVDDFALFNQLSSELADRVVAEFPVEVSKVVRIQQGPVIAYPDDALAAQRQGSVLAWVRVSVDGKPEEVVIVEGDPEFAAVVETALASAQFVPAEDRGRAIPFYTAIRVDFSASSPGAAAPSTTTSSTPGGPAEASTARSNRLP